MKPGSNSNCQKHCWHAFRAPSFFHVPESHVAEKCCMCSSTQTVPKIPVQNSHSDGGDA